MDFSKVSQSVCCLKLLWSSRFTSILYECQSFTQSRAVWIIRAFPSSYPFLHNWKLLKQLDTKKCIWYGRAQMSKCFCSVMWVVVKLDFKIERICCFCLELFSFESFVLPAVHRKKLPKEMFHFFWKFIIDFIVVVIIVTLIIIISFFFFFYMCQNDMKMNVRITFVMDIEHDVSFKRVALTLERPNSCSALKSHN